MSNRVILEPRPDKGGYMLDRPYEFSAMGKRWNIGAGFTYDGASVPKGAWYTTHSPFNYKVMRAALEHDYFCVNKPTGTTSRAAAERFRQVLEEDGVGAIKRGLMYRAVVWFGPKW